MVTERRKVEVPTFPEPFPGFSEYTKSAIRDVRAAEKNLQNIEASLVAHEKGKWMMGTAAPLHRIGGTVWKEWVARGRPSGEAAELFRNVPKEEAWQAEQETLLTARREAVRQFGRANWLNDFFTTVPELVEIGAISSFEDYLTLMKSDPTGILSDRDTETARSVIAKMTSTREIIVREDAPDWLQITPEQEEAVRKAFMLEPKQPESIHQITVNALIKSLTKEPTFIHPEDWTIEDTLKFASIMDIPPEALQATVDYTELLEPYADAIEEREAKIKAVLAGEEEWEMPEMGVWERVLFTVMSPFQMIADLIRPYLENFTYPWAGFIAKNILTPWINRQEIDEQYAKFKALGYNWWDAMSEAYQEWSLPWYLKLPLEIITDPITYVPGLALKIPGKLLMKIPWVVTRKLGAGFIFLNKGIWYISDLPFDAFKAMWRHIPKTFNQATKMELTSFRGTLIAAAQKETGKILTTITPDDVTKTLMRAMKDFAANPMKQGDVFVDLGAELIKHAPLDESAVKIWARSLGTQIDNVTPHMLADVEDVISDAIFKIGSPAENAKRIAMSLGIDDTTRNMGKLIKDIGVITSKYTNRVPRAIEIGKTAKINPTLQMMDYLVSTQRGIIEAVERSTYAKGKMLEGITLALMNKVNALERGTWRLILDRWLVRPFAEAYLGSVAYPIWNVLEGIGVSILEGVVPHQVKQEAFMRMFMGLRGVDDRVLQWSAADVAGLLGSAPGRKDSINYLTALREIGKPYAGARPISILSLKIPETIGVPFTKLQKPLPKWLAGKDYFAWLGLKWIELSDVWGTGLRANFLMKKMANYLAEYSYEVAGQDINKAFHRLVMKSYPKNAIAKKTLGLNDFELKQEMFARLATGLKDNVLGMHDLVTNTKLMQGEALKVLREATELSPQAKTLGEQMIARGEVFGGFAPVLARPMNWGRVSFGAEVTASQRTQLMSLIDKLPFVFKSNLKSVRVSTDVPLQTAATYNYITDALTLHPSFANNPGIFYHEFAHSIAVSGAWPGDEIVKAYALYKGASAESAFKFSRDYSEKFANDFATWVTNPKSLDQGMVDFLTSTFPRADVGADSINNFAKTIAGQSIADLRAYPTQAPATFRFMADQIEELAYGTKPPLAKPVIPVTPKEEYLRTGIIRELGTQNQYLLGSPFYSQRLDVMRRSNYGKLPLSKADKAIILKDERWELSQVLRDKPAFLNLTGLEVALSDDELRGFALTHNLLYGRRSSGELVVAKDKVALDRVLSAKSERELGLALGYKDITTEVGVNTPDQLMQIFQHYEVMSDTASHIPMRLLSQIMDEADELKRLHKFGKLETLWRTSRSDVESITDEIADSLIRVKGVIQAKSGLLQPKQQNALNALLERQTARLQLQEQFLKFDGRLLDDFWALPKVLRTSEEHTALRAYRLENIIKFKGEDAVLGAGDFLERKSYSQLYHNLPKPKLFRVDAAARELTPDDCAKVMGANVDALTTGLMESMTFQDKPYFIQMIKQAADAHPTYYRGFTEEKIGRVYDNLIQGLRMSPEVDIMTQKILQQVEGVKQKMILLKMNKSLSPAEEKALHGWIDDVAAGMDNIIGEPARGRIAPFGQEDMDDILAVVRGEKPAALVGEREASKIGADARIEEGLVVRPVTKKIDGETVTDYIVYLIGDEVKADAVEAAYKAGTKRPFSEKYHVTLGKALGYSDKDIQTFLRKPSRGLVTKAQWDEVRQKASESAHHEYYKAFADYTNENLIDAVGKSIYPFWTYHMYRPFFLSRTFLRKPGVAAAWGKYYEYSEYGYVNIPGTDLEFNPAIGSVFGATFGLARFDFVTYYENLGWMGEVLDYTQRLGFFPGIHITLPIALTPILSGRPPELGGVLAPIHRTGLSILVGSKTPGVSDAAKWLKEKIFHENFNEYYTATLVSSKQAKAGGTLIDGQAGIDLYYKRMRKEGLTEEEQKIWDDAFAEASWIEALRSQFPGIRLRPTEMKEAYEKVSQIIEAETGLTEKEQKDLWLHHLRPTDVIGGLPLDLRMALDQMWQYKIYFGRATTLMPPEVSDLYNKIDLYYDKVERFQIDRLALQTDTNTGFLAPTKELHFSGGEWRREYANNWSGYTSRVEGLETDPEFADVIDALTPEGQIELAKRLGFNPPPVDPMQEAIRLYFEIELQKKVDPYTGEEDYDYLRFWLEREAIRMVFSEDQRSDFDEYIRRYQTPMEVLFKEITNKYLRGYRAVSRIVLEEFTDEEKALIAEFYATTTTLDRKREIQEFVSHSGKKLMSYWDSRRTRVREALRRSSPDLDFWLYVFGYITSPKTEAAKTMITEWEKDRSSIVRGITESPMLEMIMEKVEAKKAKEVKE